jgi:hypothetical protein
MKRLVLVLLVGIAACGDNDHPGSPGIVVTAAPDLRTTETGGDALFMVALAGQPHADVVIPLHSSDIAEGTVGPDALTFHPEDFDQPQAVRAVGVDDDVIDGTVAYQVVLDPAQSDDTRYDGMDGDDVDLVNLDDDVAGISVTPITDLVTTEDGGQARFSLSLAAEPDSPVTIGLASSNTGEGTVDPASVTFTPAAWNEAKTVTVTGVDDAVTDGDQTYTIVTTTQTTDPNFAAIDPPDIALVNVDNDTGSIIVSPTTGLHTTEAGGTDRFTVVLGVQPTANVTIAVASSDTTEGRVSTAQLTFTPANYNVPQTVTVTGVNDAIADGDIPYTVTLGPAQSADPGYSGRDPDDVSVINLDDDTPGIVVTPTTGLVTSEGGGDDTFSVTLTSQPTATVTIQLTSSDTTEGTVTPPTLTFTPANWNQPHDVVVTGVDDALSDGDIAYTIVTAPAVSTDASYSGLDAADVSVTNLDDDIAGFIIDPASDLVVSELGDTDTTTVRLTIQPTAPVTIAVSTSDATEGTVSPALLTFTPLDWDTPQTITVTGVDDQVADGNIQFFIVLAPALSADARYSGLAPADVSVTNIDDETPQVYVKTRHILRTTELGTQAKFRMRLTIQPTANVRCPISSGDTTEGVVAPVSVTFTPQNFGVYQIVTVTGVDDTIKDGDIAYPVVLGACTSSDSAYAGINPPDPLAINKDNE